MINEKLTEVLDKAITDVLKVEGGYVNDPRDSGGETNFGITAHVARENGYEGPMKDLPISMAKQIYAEKFWFKPQLNAMAEISPKVALEVFDTGVNCGPANAVKFLQRALTALNRSGDLYPDLVADGIAGSGTRHALKCYMEYRVGEAEKVLMTALNVLQGNYYIELSEKHEKNEHFLFGWLRKRVQL